MVNGRLKEIFDCVDHLERIRNNYACEVMQEWSQRLSADFPDCKKVEDIRSGDVIYTGITIPYKDIPDAIAVRIQMEKRSLYCGLTYMPIKGSDWLYYKYTSFKDGYEELKKMIVRMFNYINNIPQAVLDVALFPYLITLLGEYKSKTVYGYSVSYDDGRGIGLPHIIVYDGEKAEIVYENDNKGLSTFFSVERIVAKMTFIT